MSINFEEDMGPEANSMIRKLFDVAAIDERTALINHTNGFIDKKAMSRLARTANQITPLEINKVGDRKTVGGVVYELDEAGWRKLPIGIEL